MVALTYSLSGMWEGATRGAQGGLAAAVKGSCEDVRRFQARQTAMDSLSASSRPSSLPFPCPRFEIGSGQLVQGLAGAGLMATMGGVGACLGLLPKIPQAGAEIYQTRNSLPLKVAATLLGLASLPLVVTLTGLKGATEGVRRGSGLAFL